MDSQFFSGGLRVYFIGSNETYQTIERIQMPQFRSDVYAIELTEENARKIEEAALPLGWTLDHLQDSLEVNANYGWTTTLFMELYPGTTEIVTFNDVPDSLPEKTYRLTDEVDPLFGILYKTENL